ncbi:NAD(P)-binding protein [Pseudomonas yangonensis]|uniref:NAD(P)-binding protein n=1 Tax=Pseudomonas yangonensis TaxID=2579922 RepID=UPI001379673F|nr:NAD(P)-binding protein [Pseudomonas yangonensis]
MKCLIVGGGLAGLVAAYYGKRLYPQMKVTLLERNTMCGGLLTGTEYPDEGLYFDHGTHLFRECGTADIDHLFSSLVPAGDLLYFEPGTGGHNGAIFAGRLQSNTHYPDVRGVDEHVALRDAVVTHTRELSAPANIERSSPLLAHGVARFGRAYTELILAPILSRLYQCSSDRLAGFAMCLPGITRLVAHDYEEWYSLIEDKRFREVLGVPDQRLMPVRFENGLRRYYSRNQGTRSFVRGFVSLLEELDVTVVTGAQLEGYTPISGEASWRTANGYIYQDHYDGVVLANGLVGAAAQLGLPIRDFGLEMPVPLRILDVLLDRPVFSDLSYFYGFDEGSGFYRLTNYRAFSGDSADCRISIEILNAPCRGEIDCIMAKLQAVGFLSGQRAVFTRYQPSPSPFSLPTHCNALALQALRKQVGDVLPARALVVGGGISDGLFFQNEIVLDTKARMECWLTSLHQA